MRKRNQGTTNRTRVTSKRPAGAARSAMRSVLAYAFTATIWIFTSDLVTAQFATTREMQTTVSIVKGILFIFVTSTILYLLIRNELVRVHRSLVQQQLLAQGASVLRTAENPAQAWIGVAGTICEATGADVAEVWLPGDDRSLRASCRVGSTDPTLARLDNGSGDELITAELPSMAWLWDVGDAAQPPIARVSQPPGMVRDSSLKAMRAIPVPVGKSLGGAILVWSRSRKRVSQTYGKPIRHVVGQLSDTLERFQLKADIEHSLLYDNLTGLPNRSLLLELLRAALLDAAPTDEDVLVIKIHVDLMERVEQSLGHEQADALITAAGARLSSVVGDRDTLARTQPSEFILVARSLGRSDVADYLVRLRDAAAAPVELDGASIPLSISLGVLIADGSESPQQVMTDVASALQRAHELGRGRTAFFDEGMRLSVEDALSIEVELREALSLEQFEVVYQPVVSAANRSIRDGEALVRWNHPIRGQLNPAAFIPIAEDSGLIIDIGHFVLKRACADCAGWPTINGRQLGVSVNLAAIEFLDPGLVAVIEDVLGEVSLEPSRLTIEITETTLMLDPELTEQTLRDLRTLGIRVALDDFGTGYSSLAYLQRFEIDILKIDASFVANLPSREDNCAITNAIIQMSSSLNVKTVAEGVETEGQATFLAQQGADYLQGYLFSRPVAADRFIELIREQSEH